MTARALDVVRSFAGSELAERLDFLDRVRTSRPRDVVLAYPPDDAAKVDADVVFLGGGLSLLIACEAARLGLRVAVVERARAGATHREWNASREELAPLIDSGIVDREELERLIVARYRVGRCHFHGGEDREVYGVLDHAIDAASLMDRVRAVAEKRGVRFIDGAQATGLGLGRARVKVSFDRAGAADELVTNLVVDARGSSSPYATGDLVCPTVGGVVSGLSFDPEVGDILVTTEHAERGRQHIWEGFPGKPGELTVYLFYYTEATVPHAGSLAALYTRFFETLATYKPGAATMVRPTFGYIPGWSRLGPTPRGPSPRVVLVGDAAARHSPLTFCGFGSMLRTFRPVAARLVRAVEKGETSPLVDDDAVHAWTGLLSRLMASEKLQGAALNELLDASFGSLEAMGNEPFVALLKDRMGPVAFAEFLARTSRRRPSVYRDVFRALGPWMTARWGQRLARSVLGEIV